MPAIDVLDSTWFAARIATVAALVAQPANWRHWWPGLELSVDEWRGEKGIRWSVGSVDGGRGGRLSGTAEIWLEPMYDGVVAHFFLRLDAPPGRRPSRRAVNRVSRAYRERTKQAFWSLADQLDPGRLARHTSASHACVT